MKKWTALFLALTLAVTLLAACGSKETPAQPAATEPAKGIEGTAEEVIDKIYAQHKAIDLSLVTMAVDLSDKDAVAYHMGLDSAELLADAAVSETMLGQPYSMVVAKVKDAKDAETVAKEMYEKIDMRKWICVAADTKTAVYSGDTVAFFMVSSDFAQDMSTQSFADAFLAACGGNGVLIG